MSTPVLKAQTGVLIILTTRPLKRNTLENMSTRPLAVLSNLFINTLPILGETSDDEVADPFHTLET